MLLPIIAKTADIVLTAVLLLATAVFDRVVVKKIHLLLLTNKSCVLSYGQASEQDQKAFIFNDSKKTS